MQDCVVVIALTPIARKQVAIYYLSVNIPTNQTEPHASTIMLVMESTTNVYPVLANELLPHVVLGYLYIFDTK
jgi:hypothetical protein